MVPPDAQTVHVYPYKCVASGFSPWRDLDALRQPRGRADSISWRSMTKSQPCDQLDIFRGRRPVTHLL